MNSLSKFEIQDKFFKEFIVFKTYSEMQQLTAPLQYLNIKNIDFRAHYFDGRFSELNNNPECIEYYYSRKMINGAYGARNLLPQGIYLEKSLFEGVEYYQDHQLYVREMKGLASRFLLSTGIVLVQHYPDHYEQFVFRFSPTEENQLMDFMTCYSTLLYRFVHHFHDRGKKLLEKALRSSIQLPWGLHRSDQVTHPLKWLDKKNQIHPFLSQTECKKWPLSSLSCGKYLTARELDMICLLVKGKSLAQIRRQLGISEITAAYHIKNIKKKLGSRTLFALGFKLGKISPLELGLDDKEKY